MNRFVIHDGKPYLFANNTAYAVRWDDEGFTVGGKVDIGLAHSRIMSDNEIKAKCVDLDSIKGATEPTESIDEMTVNELKAYAKANDIDLDGAVKKADILATIKAAQEGNAE